MESLTESRSLGLKASIKRVVGRATLRSRQNQIAKVDAQVASMWVAPRVLLVPRNFGYRNFDGRFLFFYR